MTLLSGAGKTLKRKVKSATFSSRKKARSQHLSADNLPWKTVSYRHEAGLDNALAGIMEFEEVDGVEVVYEEAEAGKVARFNVLQDDENVDTEKEHAEENKASPSKVTLSPVEQKLLEDIEQPFDSKKLLPNWHSLDLHPYLLRSLSGQRFTAPTPIQSAALPPAFKGKDVVGIAETGSGKTLAYGLPILHHLLRDVVSQQKTIPQSRRRVLCGLILAPTRELALQVTSHLNACLTLADVDAGSVKQEEADAAEDLLKGLGEQKRTKGKFVASARPRELSKPKGTPVISVAAVVGGMSAQKQRRVLERGVDVLVATPGRLWDILQENDDLASQIKNLRFLVLDEADRMIETGHFAELDNILRLTLRPNKEEEIEPESPAEDVNTSGGSQTTNSEHQLQTFVFSATLSKDLQRNLKARKQRKKNAKSGSTLDDLLLRLDFRDPEPEMIDLSPEGGLVSTLKESRIDCLAADKDAYLYYFLLRYPGRSLVFLSSIDGIRRLVPLLELLELKVFPLHSQLEQRQRLKNLDRFKSTPNSVLLATDIAARGLDIPAVDHVVHYQIPRSTDVYVHRNGRTARAKRSGFSLLMCAPDERKVARGLLHSLGRQEEEISEMAVELYMLDRLKARTQLARRIDAAQHKTKKENHEKRWLKEAAEAMEIELDSDLDLSDDRGKHDSSSKKQRKDASAKTAALKAELKQMLAQPLIARGISTRYITSGSRPIVDDLVSGQYHEAMVGLAKSSAGADVVASKPKKVKMKEEPVEEWSGFGS